MTTPASRLRELITRHPSVRGLEARAAALARRLGEELRRGKSLAAVLVLLLAVSTGVALRGDTIGAANEALELQAAVATMTTVVDDLPEQSRTQVEADVRVLARSIEQVLARIRNQPAPVVDDRITRGLTYLADIVGAINQELLAARDAAQAPAGVAERVRGLTGAATGPLGRVDAALTRWVEQTGDAVLEVAAGPDVVVIESTDRLLYDAVRYSAAALFLIALLVLGLRFLALGETGLGVAELFRQAPVTSLAGAAAVALFLLGSLIVAVAPGVLAGPTRVLVQAREHPCGTLAAQREHLWEAQQFGNAYLVDAIKRRMRPAGQACLGAGSELASIEAIERYAAARPATAEQDGATAPSQEEGASDVEEELRRLVSVLRDLAAEPENGQLAAAAGAGDGPASPAADGEEEVAAARPAQAAARTDVADADSSGARAPARAAPRPPAPAPRDLVTTTRVNYRSGPSLDAERLGTLPSGASVLLLREADGWSAVQLDDGRSVYVASTYLRRPE